MSQKTRGDIFLKSFFDIELYFFAHKEEQIKSWSRATGNQFMTSIMLYAEAWCTIKDNRKECKLTDSQLKMIDKIYEMLTAYQAAYDFPERPPEYRALLSNPDWQKIQKYAHEVYNRLYPYVK